LPGHVEYNHSQNGIITASFLYCYASNQRSAVSNQQPARAPFFIVIASPSADGRGNLGKAKIKGQNDRAKMKKPVSSEQSAIS
jgi:hypothetical protein